ncbi:MAG: NAD(P)/FAD-dependent oxidoreductase [Clostridiales bacterium]|nr:NAD(P)/FAD-dependent oxidoreductase [Clostridiales bacterium]
MTGNRYDVIVIGAGPAGMMAAGTASEAGANVLLLEKNESPGKKLLLTGHGRCNLTNIRIMDNYREKYHENARFLSGSFHAFPPEEVLAFFASLGVPAHEEEDGRYFPDSQKSVTILDALLAYLEKQHVTIRTNEEVTSIRSQDGLWHVTTGHGSFATVCVIIATGGASFPQTGSRGDGYGLLRSVGHSVTDLAPALAPILLRNLLRDAQTGRETAQASQDKASMSGLSLSGITLEDAAVTLLVEKNCVSKSRGSLLFTHQGISGPAAMSLSRYLPSRDEDKSLYDEEKVTVQIDLIPGIREDVADQMLLGAMAEEPNRQMRSLVRRVFGLPERVVDLLFEEALKEIPANRVTKQQRKEITRIAKALTFTVVCSTPLALAYVTRGGADVKAFDPKTMESRSCEGLYVVGELLDIDGESGGYNLQNAWATGRAAGEASAQRASTHSTMPQNMIDAQNNR